MKPLLQIDIKSKSEMKKIGKSLSKFLKIEDEADENARKICASYSRKMREGTGEWEILYNKHYEEHLSKHGIK